jgi:hypothetical protein
VARSVRGISIRSLRPRNIFAGRFAWQWAIWPPQGPGPAISASGHFHGATPTAGYAVVLSDQWEHIDATMPQPTGSVQFDIVVVYVVDADGRILLTRPFRI